MQGLIFIPDCHFNFFSLFFSIEVELIYNVVLVSGAQQSDPVVHVLLNIYVCVGYYKILNIVLYTKQ